MALSRLNLVREQEGSKSKHNQFQIENQTKSYVFRIITWKEIAGWIQVQSLLLKLVKNCKEYDSRQCILAKPYVYQFLGGGTQMYKIIGWLYNPKFISFWLLVVNYII